MPHNMYNYALYNQTTLNINSINNFKVRAK